jgi:hypothetical protein
MHTPARKQLKITVYLKFWLKNGDSKKFNYCQL